MTRNIGERARELLVRLENTASEWHITTTDHATLLEAAELLGVDLPTETFRSAAQARDLLIRALSTLGR